jgi:hypothetical protein
MMRYYFHATDGFTAVFDRRGGRLSRRGFEEVAAEVAADVRLRFGALADLSDWLVVVQDDCGEQIATLPFRDLATAGESLAAA